MENEKLKSLFQMHAEVIEHVYQVVTPVVYDIFVQIFQQVSKCTDSEAALLHTLKKTLRQIPGWNTQLIKDVFKPYRNIEKELERDIYRIGKLKALIMKENGIITNTTIDASEIEFTHCLHVILVQAAECVQIKPLPLANQDEALFKHEFKAYKVVENACVTILTDNLDKLEDHSTMFEDALENVELDIPEVSTTSMSSQSISPPSVMNNKSVGPRLRKNSATNLQKGKLTPDMLKLLKKF